MKFNKEIYWRDPGKWRRKWCEYYWDDPEHARAMDRKKYRRKKAIDHVTNCKTKENESTEKPKPKI